MILLATLCLALLPHGGRFQPPLGPTPVSAASGGPLIDDGNSGGDGSGGLGGGLGSGDNVIVPDAPGPDGSKAFPSLPGMGPVAFFEGSSWEWWFDFNEEELVDMRRRMASRTTRPEDRPFEPITDDDRQALLFPPLAEALSHNDRDMRATAAMSLGRLGLASAVPLLIPMIDDPDLFVRTQSLIALGATGRLAALEPLQEVAANRRLSDELRVFAMAAVALVPGEEADGLLAGWLAPPWLARENNVVRAGAIFAAGVHESAGLLQPMITLAQSKLCGREPSMQALLAGALGRLPSEQALPPLLSYSQRSDNQVRRSAAAGLRGQGQRLAPVQAQKIWGQLSQEGDWTIKLSLIKALAGAPVPWIGDRLQRILKTTRTGALPHIALAMGMDGNPAHVNELLKLLDQRNDTSLRSALAISLGLLGDARAAPALSQLLNNTASPQLQSGLCLAVGLVDEEQPGQIEALATLARHSHDVEVIRHGVMALGLLGARETLDQFSDSLPHIESAVDLASMIHGLGLSGDRRQIPALVTMLEVDEQPRFVLRYALGALGDLGDPRPVSPAGRYSRNANLELDIAILFELYRML